MLYHGETLTFENVYRLLSGLPVDIIDETRLALLDNVDISAFIDPCSDDPFRLQQIRLSLKESTDSRIPYLPSGDVIRSARRLSGRGVNLDDVLSYTSKGVPAAYFEVMFDVLTVGGVLPDSVDFSTLPETSLPVIRESLRRGVDFTQVISCRMAYWGALLTIASVMGGKVPRKLLSYEGSSAALDALASCAGTPYFEALLEALPVDCTEDHFDSLHDLAKLRIPLDQFPGMGTAQLMWVAQCAMEGLDWREMSKEERDNNSCIQLYTELKGKPFLNRSFSL